MDNSTDNDEIKLEVDAEGAANAAGQEGKSRGFGFGGLSGKNKTGDAALVALQAKLDKALAEKQTYLEDWQRAKADFINAKKRNEEELRDYKKYAQEGLIEELLPVLQSFEIAFGNKEAWEKADKNWRTGVEYIYNQLRGVLESNGLKEINPLGLAFDPMRDEAIEFVPVEKESDAHMVVNVIQKGYELGGKAIRAPKVKVGEFKK